MTDACINIEPYQRSFFEKEKLARTPAFREGWNLFLEFLNSPVQVTRRRRSIARTRRLKSLEFQRLDKPAVTDRWAEALLKSY